MCSIWGVLFTFTVVLTPNLFPSICNRVTTLSSDTIGGMCERLYNRTGCVWITVFGCPHAFVAVTTNGHAWLGLTARIRQNFFRIAKSPTLISAFKFAACFVSKRPSCMCLVVRFISNSTIWIELVSWTTHRKHISMANGINGDFTAQWRELQDWSISTGESGMEVFNRFVYSYKTPPKEPDIELPPIEQRIPPPLKRNPAHVAATV